MELASIFADAGDEIVQLAFLDHFPTLFATPMWEVDDETYAAPVGKPSRVFVKRALEAMLDLYRNNPSPRTDKIVKELLLAYEGTSVSPFIDSYYEVFEKFVAMTADFALEKMVPDSANVAGAVRARNIREGLEKWTKEVLGKGIPATVYVASEGIRLTVEDWARKGYAELGAERTGAEVVHVECNHFKLMENEKMVQHLQYGWRGSSEREG